MGVRNLRYNGKLLGRATKEGESPVHEIAQTPDEAPEYRGTRVILRESGRPTFQG
jgi:hypothetical protein